jgi:hypothetical protein
MREINVVVCGMGDAGAKALVTMISSHHGGDGNAKVAVRIQGEEALLCVFGSENADEWGDLGVELQAFVIVYSDQL